jgi:hypothetical protein
MAQDIGLLLRGLGASFSNQVPQFRQEMAQEEQARARQQEMQMRQQEFSSQQAERSRNAQMQSAEMMQARQAAAFQDAEAALRMGARGDWEGIIGLAEDRMRLDQEMGGPLEGDMTPMLADLASRAVTGDPVAANMALSQLARVVASGFDRGVLQKPEVVAPKPISASNIQMTTEGPMVPMQQADGTITMVRAPFTPVEAKKPERKFATDRYGVARYIDTGEPVFDLAALAGGNIAGLPTGQQTGGNILQEGEPPEFASMPPDVLAEQRAKRQKAESEITAAQQTRALDLRSRFESLEPVALYENRLGQMQTIISAVEPSSGPSEELQANIEDGIAPETALDASSDISLIFAFMKMLDPTSVVREGEFATAQNSGGIEDQIRNVYNRLRDGQRLTPEQRANFVNRAYRIYKGSESQYTNAIQRQAATAKQFNVPEELTYFDLRPSDQFNIDSVIESIRSQDQPSSNGKTFFQQFNEFRNR